MVMTNFDSEEYKKMNEALNFGNSTTPAYSNGSNTIEREKHQGLRFNTGKLRYDLVHPWSHEQLVKVFTKGAEKYAPRNWEKGMSWSSVLSSLKRHLAAIELGEDYDLETGLLHSAHVMWNAHALTAYYKIYPQGDDRVHNYITAPKVGLDIDEVLADWLGGYKEKYGYKPDHEFDSWYLHYKILDRCKDELGNAFYTNLKPKIKPSDLPFEPHCYITSRNIPQVITEEWIYKNGFPCRPVYTIKQGESKVELAKKSGIDIFVDDVYSNFLELNKAGICCYLWDAPHNKKFEVGYKRLYNFKDLI